MDTLFLRLPARQADGLHAVGRNASGEPVTLRFDSRQSLADWLAEHAQVPVVLIVPPAWHTDVVIQATARQRKEAGNELVALAEEQLAEDYDLLTWSLIPLDDQQVLARGMQTELLDAWVSLIEAPGNRVLAAIPEVSLFEVSNGQWLWLPQGDEIYLQTAPGEAALLDPATVPDLAGLTGDSLRADVTIVHPLSYRLPALPAFVRPLPASWSDWTQAVLGMGVTWARHPANWLKGRAVRHEAAVIDKRVFLAAALTLVVFLLQGMMNRQDAARDVAAADQASSDSVRLYRGWFPQERSVTDVERQLKAKLPTASRPALLQLMQTVAQSAPAGKRWQLRELDYGADKPLTLVVLGESEADMKTWMLAMRQNDLAASLVNVQQEAGQVLATLRIESDVASAARGATR